MNTSPETDKIIPAFATALAKLDDVTKTHLAKIEGKQKYDYTFANLADTLAAAKPVLTECDLAVSQPVTDDGITTLIVHSSGQWLSFGPFRLQPTQNTPQAHGSAITYARRYQLMGVLNLATVDDDGKAASRKVDPERAERDRRIDALRDDWAKLTPEIQDAGHAYAKEHGFRMHPDDLARTPEHLDLMESWVDEQLAGE